MLRLLEIRLALSVALIWTGPENGVGGRPVSDESCAVFTMCFNCVSTFLFFFVLKAKDRSAILLASLWFLKRSFGGLPLTPFLCESFPFYGPQLFVGLKAVQLQNQFTPHEPNREWDR